MKNKNKLWSNIGAILICIGLLMSVGVMLYECFVTNIYLFVFILGLLIVVIGSVITAINRID